MFGYYGGVDEREFYLEFEALVPFGVGGDFQAEVVGHLIYQVEAHAGGFLLGYVQSGPGGV